MPDPRNAEPRPSAKEAPASPSQAPRSPPQQRGKASARSLPSATKFAASEEWVQRGTDDAEALFLPQAERQFSKSHRSYLLMEYAPGVDAGVRPELAPSRRGGSRSHRAKESLGSESPRERERARTPEEATPGSDRGSRALWADQSETEDSEREPSSTSRRDADSSRRPPHDPWRSSSLQAEAAEARLVGPGTHSPNETAWSNRRKEGPPAHTESPEPRAPQPASPPRPAGPPPPPPAPRPSDSPPVRGKDKNAEHQGKSAAASHAARASTPPEDDADGPAARSAWHEPPHGDRRTEPKGAREYASQASFAPRAPPQPRPMSEAFVNSGWKEKKTLGVSPRGGGAGTRKPNGKRRRSQIAVEGRGWQCVRSSASGPEGYCRFRC